MPKLAPFAIGNPKWLELPMSQINFHGPKDVRAIEVQAAQMSLPSVDPG